MKNATVNARESGLFFEALNVLANLALAILFIAIAASFFAPFGWFPDLLTNFRLQYTVGGLALALWYLCSRQQKESIISLALMGLSAAQIVTSVSLVPPSSNTQNSFKIIHYNRYYALPDTEEFRDFMRESGADVIVIEEARQAHLQAAKKLEDLYPYQIHEPRRDAFGVVVLSKHELTNSFLRPFPVIALENFQTRFTVTPFEGRPVTIYAIHPPPPTNLKLYQQHNSELLNTAHDLAQEPAERLIMLGDWNMSPYSPRFKSFVEETGLKNEYTSPLPFATWPSHFKLPFLQIPIDHILHRGGLSLLSKKKGPAMGSDHYPVIAEFAIED